MSAIGTMRSVVLECREPEPLAVFWSQVLDREITQRHDDWWALAPDPGGSRLAFQVSSTYEPPAWPGGTGEQQVHLDIEVADLEVATTAVVELGARYLTEVSEPDEAWRVFTDPAGHPFCLVAIA